MRGIPWKDNLNIDHSKYVLTERDKQFLGFAQNQFWDVFKTSISFVIDEFERGRIYNFASAQQYIKKSNDIYETGYEIFWWREDIVNWIPYSQRSKFSNAYLSPQTPWILMCAFIEKNALIRWDLLIPEKNIHFTRPWNTIFIMTLHARCIIEMIDKINNPPLWPWDWFNKWFNKAKETLKGLLSPLPVKAYSFSDNSALAEVFESHNKSSS